MKRVLITGKNSYIGDSVKKWLEKCSQDYIVDVVDMIGNDWKKEDFSKYDCVYHVAGIAHRKDAPEELYEKVNYKLALEVAERVKESNVSQFILMSSGAVYAQNDRKHREIRVNEKSNMNPSTMYGLSKKKADLEIEKILSGSSTKFVILRPPMVYGPNAKGNYNSLSKLAKITIVFPNIRNARSMIYIDNLCEFVRLIINEESEGVYLPQNKEYVNTTKLVNEIARCNGRKITTTRFFNLGIYLMGKLMNPINKVFGTYVYETEEYFSGRYQLVDFEESIRLTEEGLL